MADDTGSVEPDPPQPYVEEMPDGSVGGPPIPFTDGPAAPPAAGPPTAPEGHDPLESALRGPQAGCVEAFLFFIFLMLFGVAGFIGTSPAGACRSGRSAGFAGLGERHDYDDDRRADHDDRSCGAVDDCARGGDHRAPAAAADDGTTAAAAAGLQLAVIDRCLGGVGDLASGKWGQLHGSEHPGDADRDHAALRPALPPRVLGLGYERDLQRIGLQDGRVQRVDLERVDGCRRHDQLHVAAPAERVRLTKLGGCAQALAARCRRLRAMTLRRISEVPPPMVSSKLWRHRYSISVPRTSAADAPRSRAARAIA